MTPALSAEALRRAFDETFAAAPGERRREDVPLLLVRAGAARVGIRALETAGLVTPGRIEPVPSRRRELLGVTGLRGALLPVYGLARLLGLDDGGEAPRWVLLAGGAARVGLACGALEAYRRVSPRELEPASAPSGALREVAQLADGPLPVASVPALLHAIGLP